LKGRDARERFREKKKTKREEKDLERIQRCREKRKTKREEQDLAKRD